MTFDEIINARRSVRVFEEPKQEDTKIVQKNLERAVLSPNSSNMQLWEFYIVSSEENKEKMAKACLNQSAARTASRLVVFVTRQDKWKKHANWNAQQLKEFFKGKDTGKRQKDILAYYEKLMPIAYGNDFLGILTLLRGAVVLYHKIVGKPMASLITHADQRVTLHKTCALAAQTFMLGMAADGYDTCPMEGFDEGMVRKILNLPSAAEVCMVVGCGKRKPEGIYNPRWRVPNEEVIFEV